MHVQMIRIDGSDDDRDDSADTKAKTHLYVGADECGVPVFTNVMASSFVNKNLGERLL